ncbi:MAG: hypothetical protein RR553_03275 [Akkermansia sp.]
MIRCAFNVGEISESAACRVDMDMYHRALSRAKNMVIGQMGGVWKRRGSIKLECENVPGVGRLFPFVAGVDDVLVIECAISQLRVLRVVGKRLEVLFSSVAPWDSSSKLDSIRVCQLNDVVHVVGSFYPHILKRYSNKVTFEKLKFSYSPGQEIKEQTSAMTITFEQAVYPTLSAPDVFKASNPGDIVTVQQRIETRNEVADYNKGFDSFFHVFGPSASPLNVTIPSGAMVIYRSGGVDHYYTCLWMWPPSMIQGGNQDPGAYPNYFRSGWVFAIDCICKTAWSVFTQGVWEGEVAILRGSIKNGHMNMWWFGGGDYEVLRRLVSTKDAPRNYNESGSEEDECHLGLVVYWASMDFARRPTPNIVVNAFNWDREFIIKEVKSNSVASVSTSFNGIKDGVNTETYSTKFWAMGAFSDSAGYPVSIAFHQDRLWLAGTSSQPQTVWASRVGDYYNFDINRVGDDKALRFTIASTGQNRICWVEPLKGLSLGTAEAEWSLSAQNGIIDSNSSFFNRQSAVGSMPGMESLSIENGLVFVQRNGKRLRQFAYSLEADGYMAEDLTVFADHILNAGVKELSYQRSPEPVLWAVLDDGSAAQMTYNMLQQVKAWGRFEVADYKLESVCVLPRMDGGSDDVILRLVDGSGVACYALHGDDAPYLDLAVDGVGVPVIAEFVTNALEGQDSQGSKKHNAVVSARFVGTETAGMTLTNDGIDWVNPGISKQVIDGWEDFTASATWGKEFRVGFRHVGNCPFRVDGIRIDYKAQQSI